MAHILSITGSDSVCTSGLQQDIRVIAEMGAQALTITSCMVVRHDRKQINEILALPIHFLCKQIAGVFSICSPKAVKVGLVPCADAVRIVAEKIQHCSKVVIAPGILSSDGVPLVDGNTISAIRKYLIPKATILMLRCAEAERILDCSITTDEDMLRASQLFISMGAQNVMLRGGKVFEGRITALLASGEGHQFFSSYNVDGWQQHGVGGALATAVTTRLGMGDNVNEAISNAHEYVHCCMVYSVANNGRRLRPTDIYNEFLSLISSHYGTAHDVSFYAERLNISTRYLSRITADTVGKTPKQIIADYLFLEAQQLLAGSRLSVKEVSCKLGFSNATLFCRFFRQRQQQSPNVYRLSVKTLPQSE